MKVTKLEDEVLIAENSIVTVTKMNHIVEVQHMEKKNTTNHIKKLDSDRYVELATGEIKEFQHSETRADNTNSLRQTFKKLRYLINNNFEGRPNELFITLTYAIQTRDHIQIGKDYDNFLKRLKRKYKDRTTVDAIRVLEPHASGNFHLHVLLRFNDVQSIYIPNQELADIWSNGFVSIQSLKDVDNIGAYVSAYLSDIELPEGVTTDLEVIEKEVQGQKKKFVKGARLIFYPTGVNIFTKTKGIEYPKRKDMAYKDIKKIVGAGTPHYKKSIKIADEETEFFNTITYEQYNLKRHQVEHRNNTDNKKPL